MSKIECTFYRPSAEEWSIGECDRIIQKLVDDYSAICSGKAGVDDTCRYAGALLSHACPLEKKPGMLFLGLIDPQTMPAEERVYLFYVPSYFGTAICIRAAVERPEILNDFKNREIFRGMLLGCTARKFHGAGYEWLSGLISTLMIFVKAKTDKFVKYNWFLCPDFSKLYRDSLEMLEARIEADSVRSVWGAEYTDEAREVISLSLQMRNEK